MKLLLFMLMGLVGGIYGDAPDEPLPHLKFHSCAESGWSCSNGNPTIQYTCNKTVEQVYDDYNRKHKLYKRTSNFTLDLSEWENHVTTRKSLIVKDCHFIDLFMHTEQPSAIISLFIEDSDLLNINAPKPGAVNHPSHISFHNIDFIPTLGKHAISSNDTTQVKFSTTTIGMVEKEAISLKTPLQAFDLRSVVFLAMKERAVSIVMDWGAVFRVSGTDFPVLRPNTFLVTGGSTIFENSKFKAIQKGSIRASVESFNFANNQVFRQVGQIVVTSPDVVLTENTFSYVTRLEDLIYSTTDFSRSYPEQITFSFYGNTIQTVSIIDKNESPDSPYPELSECRSSVSSIKQEGNCTKQLDSSEMFENDQSSNSSLLNIFICENQVPPSYRTKGWPVKNWIRIWNKLEEGCHDEADDPMPTNTKGDVKMHVLAPFSV